MISTSEVSYHRSTQGVRCLNVPEATLLKERERENSRLRQAVFDLTLDELILQKAPDPAQVLAIADKAGGRLGKARAIRYWSLTSPTGPGRAIDNEQAKI